MTHLRTIDVSGLPPAPLTDQPSPMLEWVDIARMRIDDRYQRPLAMGNWNTIRKIATDFRWARFSPVLLAPMEGGLYAVIDGQHRVHAAALCGVERVPAMIVLVPGHEQALAFIEINTTRTAVSQHSLFRAALTAQTPWALQAEEAVTAAGCRLMRSNGSARTKKPGEVYAIGLIKTLVLSGKARTITTTLTAIRAYDTKPSSMSILLYSDYLLNPLTAAVAQFPGLTAEKLTELLHKKRPMNVIDAAKRLAKVTPKATRNALAREAFVALIRQHLQGKAEAAQ